MPLTRIEFTKIRSLDDIYRQLAEQTDLPEHFGRNLDALYDVLTGDLEGPLMIVWRRHTASEALLGAEKYRALLALLHGAAAERADLELILD